MFFDAEVEYAEIIVNDCVVNLTDYLLPRF
jgi:hypothetical protein